MAIGCDCDQDRSKDSNNKPKFHGLEVTIKKIRELRRERIKDLKITWFIRCDDQIKNIFGTHEYMYRKEITNLKLLEEEGDEIGWHPHMWRKESKSGNWYQEVDDLRFQSECVQRSFEKIPYAFLPKSTHMGWCYMNNTILKSIKECGIRTDCSAIKGHNTLSAKDWDRADWSKITGLPYIPCMDDYQSECDVEQKEKENFLMFIPASTGEDKLLTTSRFLRETVKRKSLSKISIKEQVPLITLRSKIFERLFDNWLEKQDMRQDNYFLTYFHPDENLDFQRRNNALRLAYSKNALEKNINYIIKKAEAKNSEIIFTTVDELRDQLVSI